MIQDREEDSRIGSRIQGVPINMEIE